VKKLIFIVIILGILVPHTVVADTSATCTITGSLGACVSLDDDGTCVSNVPVEVIVETEQISAVVQG
jgi:hypothetical protein